MQHATINRLRSRPAARRLALLFLFGWFNLVLQPCSAATAGPCLNCPRQDNQSLCATQPDQACAVSSGVTVSGAVEDSGKVPGSNVAHPALFNLALLLPETVPNASRHCAANPPFLSDSDPPPRIRFCRFLI